MLFYRLKQTVLTLTTCLVSVAVLAQPVMPVAVGPEFSTVTPSAPTLTATSYILIDANSGRVLAAKEPDTKLPPASLTKLMSLYVISAALKNGQIHMDDKVQISTKAWKTEGSRMFVKAGEEVPVKDLLQGIIVASGNDATVALAEHIAGSEETFADMMNETAKRLGMTNSHFTDSTGLPNAEHYASARDLALLTQSYVQAFPEDYSFYSQKWIEYNGVRQPNRNRLLWRYQFADGLKTGHTTEAGYCLVASAKKGNMRLISVVMGEPNDQARMEDSIRLFTYGFRFFETKKLYSAGAPVVEARVWGGDKSNIPLGVTQDLYVTIPAGLDKRLQSAVVLDHALKAPVIQGQVYGQLNLTLNNQPVTSAPLVALNSSQTGNLLRRAVESISYHMQRLFSQSEEKMNTG
jgi:D-alanyl-D-alanine carboxypeptidase (penicillin-binding protein 5/6)